MSEAAAIGAYVLLAGALVCVLQQLSLAAVGLLFEPSAAGVPTAQPEARLLVLVPAHNESRGLTRTVASLLAQAYPRHLFSVIVLADNCTDDTEAVAREAGAEVWVRTDLTLRGKGQALAWAFAQIDSALCDAIVVVDADTEAEPDLLAGFAAVLEADAAVDRLAAYQARYEFRPNPGAPAWLQTLTLAAKAAENSFVYRSRDRLGLANLLQGNGFCVPLGVLARVPWAAGSIVEDAEYAVALCRAGIRVRFLDRVRVVSRIPASEADSAPQKVRWAKGMMLLMRQQAPRLLLDSLRQGRFVLAEAALMLLLSSRMTAVYLLAGGATLLLFAPAQELPRLALLAAAIFAGQALYLLLMLCATGQGQRSFTQLWFVPRYLGHLTLAQMRSVTSLGTKVWTRTVR